MWAANFFIGLLGVAAAGNPFAEQKFYVNPANQKEYDGSIATASGIAKKNLQQMRNIPSAYWIDKASKIRGNSTSSLEGILQDAASKSPPELVVVIWYDLPNRDCDAKASNGEMCCTAKQDGTCDYDTVSDCAGGIAKYKSEYCDPFVSVLAAYKGKVPVVVVVEPDSLPNLATNAGHPHCGNEATQNAYKTGIKYALEQLTTKTDATIYLDAAHGGWLGWEDNAEKFLMLLKGMDLPVTKMRGFATNVANYQPVGALCPWEPDQGYRNGFCLNGKHKEHPCCMDACKLESQYNPANNELNYAQELTKAAKAMLSWDAVAIIDTGRNGVPDMRSDCSNWCNPRNSGAGWASTAETNNSMIDAFFWLKTPGESDGCSQLLPSGDACPRYDTMCGSADSIGTRSGEPKAPEAGQWFDYQVKQLAANARLIPEPGPLPPPTPAPPSPSPPSPSPAPPSPAPGTGQCCYGGCQSGNCQGGWCGQSRTNCEGNCNGQWCPKDSMLVV
jgi:cellulose 1,4-beta-cellobiosidase